MSSFILNTNRKFYFLLSFLITFFVFIVINFVFKSSFGGEIHLISAIASGLCVGFVSYLLNRK